MFTHTHVVVPHNLTFALSSQLSFKGISKHNERSLLYFPTYLLAIFGVLHSFVVDPDFPVVGNWLFYVCVSCLTSFYFALQLTALLKYNSHII